MSDWDHRHSNDATGGTSTPAEPTYTSQSGHSQSAQMPITRPALSRLGSKQRNRQIQAQQPINANEPTESGQYQSALSQASRPIIPRLHFQSSQQSQQQQPLSRPGDPDSDDPFAYHAQPHVSPQPSQQPFVHPLMADQAQSQQPHHPYNPPSTAGGTRDPSLQRIENALRDNLSREPRAFTFTPMNSNSSKQLPPLSRPSVPPLKLGDVIHQVLGPRALTNPAAAPAVSEANKAELRDKVARMKLHENVNPAVAGQADVLAGLEPDRANFIDTGVHIGYDENDEDEPESFDESKEERRPLSPKKALPTSNLPIDSDDLVRRPDELREAHVDREELMHFRRNQATASAANSITSSAAIPPTGKANLASTLSNTLDANSNKFAGVKRDSLQETYVESKTTGEFIRVRQSSIEQGLAADERRTGNIHNIQDFDAAVDTIIDSVNNIQGWLSAFWLMISGLLVGACLIQVYLVYLKSDDRDFLTYYSVLAGPARKVIYVLIGFSVSLAWWRFSLERRDNDRHIHFITRYHLPNSSNNIWWRNIICGVTLSIAFLMTLIMVPLDDWMENQFQMNHNWFSPIFTPGDLPTYFRDRIDDWYRMSMVRLIFVSIGWICIIHRFGKAEYQYYELAQQSNETHANTSTALFTASGHPNRPSSASSLPLGSSQRLNRVGLNSATTGVSNPPESFIPTARSSNSTSHMSASQRIGLRPTTNGAAPRFDANNTIHARR